MPDEERLIVESFGGRSRGTSLGKGRDDDGLWLLGRDDRKSGSLVPHLERAEKREWKAKRRQRVRHCQSKAKGDPAQVGVLSELIIYKMKFLPHYPGLCTASTNYH